MISHLRGRLQDDMCTSIECTFSKALVEKEPKWRIIDMKQMQCVQFFPSSQMHDLKPELSSRNCIVHKVGVWQEERSKLIR